MTPGDIRLLGTARLAGQRLKTLAPEAEAQGLIDAIDVVLNELILRRDRGFFEDYLTRGAALAGLPEPVPADLDDKALDQAIRAVTIRLEEIVGERGSDDTPATQELLDRIVAWEDSLYAYRMTAASDDGRIADPRARFTAPAIEAYLRQRKPEWPGLTVESVSLIPGGFSKITVLLDVTDAVNGQHGLAIRAEPALKFMELEGADIAREYPAIQLVHEAGIPVAEPLWLELDTAHFGTRFIVSRKVNGQVHGTVKAAGESVPEATGREVAATLAALHKVDYTRWPELLETSHLGRWAAIPALSENTRSFIAYWRERAEIHDIGPSPLVRRALDWLARHVPADAENDAPVLLHGDIGLHNMLIEDGKVAALLDWEISRIGDRAEELTNFLSATAGVIDRADFIRWYREAGGQEVGEYRLRYFDVFHSVKIAICALSVLRRVENHREASIQLAVFGLQYLHYITSRMTGLIRAADAVRASA
jgi:aminoglycoside phosphotransferase (APT) family kinase protein